MFNPTILQFLFPAIAPLGILSGLFSSKKEKSSSETSQEEKGSITKTDTGTESRTSEASDIFSQLPPELIASFSAFAEQLIAQGGAAGAESKALRELGQVLVERAGKAEQQLSSDIDAIVLARQREGQEKIRSDIARLAAATGSTQNSFVAQAGIDANVDLLTELAGVEGELNIKAQEQATAAFLPALQAISGAGQLSQGGVEGIASIAGILKGATSERNLSETQVADLQQKSVAESIQNLTGQTSSKGKSSGFSAGFDLSKLFKPT